MLNCPRCDATVDGLACPACGFREPTLPPLPAWKDPPRRDPEATREVRTRLRELLEQVKPPQPGRGWAERLLARHEAGERLPQLALDYAREVAGGKP